MKKHTLESGKKSVIKSINSSVRIPKNRKAEDELLNNEELLKTTLDSSFNYIQVFKAVRDKHGKIIDFTWVLNNRKTIEFQGDRVGKSLLQFNPGVIEAGLFDKFVQVTETGIPHTLEFYYDHEGFDDWLHQTIVKLKDGFILTGEIITERKRIEQEVYQRSTELKENRDLLQSIADAIPDMVSVQEYPSRKIIYFNREPYSISGLNADELSKKTIEDRHKLVHPEDLSCLQQYADRFATLPNNDIATVEYRVRNDLNEWIWLSARGKVFERDEKDKVISIVVVVQNINAQKKDKEEIAKQHYILKQAEELVNIGSWKYNIKTKEFLWSDGMYALFNIRRGKAAPLKNNKGVVEKIIGVNMDITASLESAQKIIDLNESLLTMNKELNALNSELKSFNSITANNYNEALRNVYINLETIITSDARHLSDSGRANIRRAQSAIQKMKLLTNDINHYLELYNAGIKKELISPKIILQDILREAKEKIEEVNGKIEIEELPTLSADPVLLAKLFTHLIDNSIKFRKPGMDPVIKIKQSNTKESAMPYIIITVTDNGMGFETTEKIFELFTQLPGQVKHKGSGMGLSICKKIMEMHSGYITAEAEPGKGASFHCFFPE